VISNLEIWQLLVSEARNITELEQLDELDQKKGYSTLKSHNEILDLFKELETIEDNVKNPDTIDESTIEPEIAKQEIEPIDITEEIVKEPVISEVIVKKEKKPKSKFSSKLRKKKKLKEPKSKKRFLKLRRSKSIKTEDAQGELKQIKNTFTLKLNGQGELVGLNIKKPITKKEKTPLLKKLFKKGEAKEKAPAEPEVKGIKGIPVKIKGIISKITSKLPIGKKGKSSESKSSGIGGKVKGIFSRKSKK